MKHYPIPDNEIARLAYLDALGIVNSPREPQFDALVALACKVFQVPIALVSLVGKTEQTFKAVQGLNVRGTERESAFCNYPVAAGEMLVVEDATVDARFSCNRLVVGDPQIRFYAGAPISAAEEFVLGTLCIIDTKPRAVTGEEIATLRELAAIASALMRQFRDARGSEQLALEVQQKNDLLLVQSQNLARYRKLFDRGATLINIGAWDWELETGEITWTDGMFDMHEMPRGSKLSNTPGQGLYRPEYEAELRRLFEISDHTCSGFTFEGELVTAKGNQRWAQLTVDVECQDGKVVRRFGMKQDITEQKIVWDRMRYLAECDPLTSLSNRAVLKQRLVEETDASGMPRCTTLLLIDLDGFKHINDRYGHEAGDACLVQIADRLRQACPNAQLVTRLGGDEFALLLEGNDLGAATDCANLVLERMRCPTKWQVNSFQLSASIGIAASQDTGSQLHLLTQADLALYAAKAAGRNTLRVFVPEMKNAAKARFETIKQISRALTNEQLELFYQPKIRLVDNSLAGFEALLRWRRPDGRVDSAGVFAAAFEDPVLSRDIGSWVVEAALKQAQRWQRSGLDFGHIAINLSASQFRDPGFADSLIVQIASHNLKPEMIEAEITEGVFLGEENGNVRRALDTLRETGVRIALDDFGTGFASLTHLRGFPVDVIKIDRSFVQHIFTSSRDDAILQSTLFLARHLGLDVVAEGVEDERQCEYLRALGCRFIQGFLFSKAICADKAAEWCSAPVARSA